MFKCNCIRRDLAVVRWRTHPLGQYDLSFALTTGWIMRCLVPLLISAIALSSLCRAAYGQGMVVIPKLSVGSSDSAALKTKWNTGSEIDRGGFDLDLVGSMSPTVSNRFWGEATKSLVSGTRLTLDDSRGSAYTELGQVHSGSWRLVVATTLAVSTDEKSGEARADSAQTASALARFAAGGGNLSIGGNRPIVLAKLGGYTRGGLFFMPRAWLNVPSLSSAQGVTDYGGELAASLLVQRYANDESPFLTFELRGGIASGSREFHQSLQRTSTRSFGFAVPSVTVAVRDQINLSLSTLMGELVKGDPVISLSLSLLPKRAQ